MPNKERIQTKGTARPIISYRDLVAMPPYSELTFLVVGEKERQRVASVVRYAVANHPREDGQTYRVRSKKYPYERGGRIVTIKTVPSHDSKRRKNDSA